MGSPSSSGRWAGDRWQEDGGPPLLEVQRDGPVQLPAPAALGVRHLQELRGPVPCCLHGWQRCCHAWQGHLLRAQGGGFRRRQEEMSELVFVCTIYQSQSFEPPKKKK